jgi:hypothetical protein
MRNIGHHIINIGKYVIRIDTIYTIVACGMCFKYASFRPFPVTTTTVVAEQSNRNWYSIK